MSYDDLMRAVIAWLPLVFCHCGTDGFFEVISPAAPGAGTSSCGTSTRGPVDSIEVGERQYVDPGMEMFVLLEEGAPATIMLGTQGADMLVLAYRVMGAGSQSCIAQRTEISDDAGERLSFNLLAKSFEPQPDGTSISDWIYLPGPYVPGPVTIEVSIGGRTLVRHVMAGG
jgi:hypothetical protein